MMEGTLGPFFSRAIQVNRTGYDRSFSGVREKWQENDGEKDSSSGRHELTIAREDARLFLPHLPVRLVLGSGQGPGFSRG